MEFIRVDYLFSYWIIFWFLIYYITNLVYPKVNIPNPKLALYLGLIENFITFFYLIWLNSNVSIIVKYLVMIFIIKVIPIYLIQEPIHFWKDLNRFGFVFLVYNLYLLLNQETIYSVYDRTFRSVKNGENSTMMFYIFDKLGF